MWLRTRNVARPTVMSTSMRTRSRTETGAFPVSSGMAEYPRAFNHRPQRRSSVLRCRGLASVRQDRRIPLTNVVPVQEGRGVADLGVGRATPDPRRLPAIDVAALRCAPCLIRGNTSAAIRAASLSVEPDAKMTRQLDDAPRRVGEQVFVALNEHVGARHPEPIVGENLMDHPLAEQLLEGHPSFMHQ